MERKLFQEALNNVIRTREPANRRFAARRPGRRKDSKNSKKSGTTIFALRYADGIMLCGDRKTTGYYYDVISLRSVKINQIGPRSALSYSGLVGSGQKLTSLMKDENQSFFDTNHFPLSLPGQAHFATDFCREYFENDPSILEIEVILSGCDWDNSFHIYCISEDGSCMEFSNGYYVSGSGTYNGRTILDSQWRPNLTLAQALKLAMETQYQAGLRDSGSSHLAIARPNIAIITTKGFKFLEDVMVEKVRAKVLASKKAVV